VTCYRENDVFRRRVALALFPLAIISTCRGKKLMPIRPTRKSLHTATVLSPWSGHHQWLIDHTPSCSIMPSPSGPRASVCILIWPRPNKFVTGRHNIPTIISDHATPPPPTWIKSPVIIYFRFPFSWLLPLSAPPTPVEWPSQDGPFSIQAVLLQYANRFPPKFQGGPWPTWSLSCLRP
jgi:hypothetical protein